MLSFKIENISDVLPDIISLKKSGKSVPEVASALLPFCVNCDDVGILTTKVKNRWDNYVRNNGGEGESLYKDSVNEGRCVSMNSDGSRNSEVSTKVSNLEGDINLNSVDDILRLHNLPSHEWEILSYRTSTWQAQGPDGDIIDMVSSKITVKPLNKDEQLIKEIIKKNEEVLGPIGKRRHPVPVVGEDADKIGIVAYPDFHLDKREGNNAMPFETQVQRFYAILDWFEDNLLKIKDLKKIAFYWSQDFFNYDYLTEETTSRRNKQDSTVGYQRMVSEGNVMLANAILKLEKIAPVELFYTRSNHDQHTAFNTMQGLYLAFRNDNNVIIDGMNADDRARVWDEVTSNHMLGIPNLYDTTFDTLGRHYLMWGKCLFGFAHGDMEGKRIHNVMQTEADMQFAMLFAKKNLLNFEDINELPDFEEKFAWSKTATHVFFCGHWHSKQKLVIDESGVEVIYLPTEMTGDAWHTACGYIGAQRRIELYVYAKDGSYSVYGDSSKNIKDRYSKKIVGGC